MRQAGLTIVELLIALVVVTTIGALGWSGLRHARESAALEAAARAVTRQLALGKTLAISRREPIRLRAGPGTLALFDARGVRVAALDIGPGRELPIDSLIVRPASIRFNARGHAGAGSVYLFRGRKGVRLVCNFLGRVRREPLTAPG